MADLIRSFEVSGKNQPSVIEVDGPNISNYGVVMSNGEPGSVVGLFDKSDADKAPSNLASIGRYVLTPDILTFYAINPQVPSWKFNLQMQSNRKRLAMQ